MPQGNKFKGNDRAILKKAQFVLNAIAQRDIYLDNLIADEGRKSSKVSNRVRMIPAMEPVPATGISAAVAVLQSRIAVLLAQTW